MTPSMYAQKHSLTAMFPSIQMTGSSHKHVSKYIPFNDSEAISNVVAADTPLDKLGALADAGFSDYLLDEIAKLGLMEDPEVSWFLPKSEFSRLVYQIAYLSLIGQKADAPDMLKNTFTGNTYIPIGSKGHCVIGFRCWGQYGTGSGSIVGARLRFELIDVALEKKRLATVQSYLRNSCGEVEDLLAEIGLEGAVDTEMAAVKQAVKEAVQETIHINEPTYETQNQRVSVRLPY